MEELLVVDGFDADGSDEGSSDGGGEYLGGTLSGAFLAQTIVDTHTANELGLVRSELKRLRNKVERLEHEKDVMVDDFNITTQMLLDRIRVLESEKSGSDSRPATAAILERVEATWGSQSRKSRHQPEVMRIEEEDHARENSPAKSSTSVPQPTEEYKECGNCGQHIPERNFTAHSVYCYRNHFHCDVCNQVLLIKDKQAHIKEWTDPERFINAASDRDLVTLQAMCSHGADFQTGVHPRTGDTVLHIAAAHSDIALIELCMGYGVDVDPMNEQGETPLHMAATKAEASAVRLLVELGANLNISNSKGESPLMLVCRRGLADAARYLVERKADTEARTKLGDTPLEIAQRLGFQETVMALSMAGAPLRSGTPKRVRQRSSSRKRSGSPMAPVPVRGPSSNNVANGGYPPPMPPAQARRPAHSPTSPTHRPQTIAG